MALQTTVTSPPLAFVLSEDGVQIVLFPFQDDDGHDIIDAIHLPQWLFWDEYPMDTDILILLLMLTGRQEVPIPQIEYTHPTKTKKRNITDFIQTEKQHAQTLMQRVEEQQEELQQKVSVLPRFLTMKYLCMVLVKSDNIVPS